ncbi:MAG: hypothetical protein ACI4IV_07520 [Acutalibacteraceae bacterium]
MKEENMVNIPCSLDCENQENGLCRQNTASEIRCVGGPCPYYKQKSSGKDNALPLLSD